MFATVENILPVRVNIEADEKHIKYIHRSAESSYVEAIRSSKVSTYGINYYQNNRNKQDGNPEGGGTPILEGGRELLHD